MGLHDLRPQQAACRARRARRARGRSEGIRSSRNGPAGLGGFGSEALRLLRHAGPLRMAAMNVMSSAVHSLRLSHSYFPKLSKKRCAAALAVSASPQTVETLLTETNRGITHLQILRTAVGVELRDPCTICSSSSRLIRDPVKNVPTREGIQKTNDKPDLNPEPTLHSLTWNLSPEPSHGRFSFAEGAASPSERSLSCPRLRISS